MWLTARLSNGESNKYDSSNWPLNDREETCVIILKTLCVSVTGVYRVKTTHAHEDKPLISPEQGRKHDMAINMPKMKVGQTSKKEARHVEQTHEMNFLCLYTCMLLNTGWYDNKKQSFKLNLEV